MKRALWIGFAAAMLAVPVATMVARAQRVKLPSYGPVPSFSLVDQEGAIREFHRVLKPGGLLLFAESTRAYIESWLIRALFRHPMEVQKSAPEYLALIRSAGFEVPEDAVSLPYLWWSRSDLGLAERIFGVSPPAVREETLLNLVALRR